MSNAQKISEAIRVMEAELNGWVGLLALGKIGAVPSGLIAEMSKDLAALREMRRHHAAAAFELDSEKA